ncbi:MAG TPA: MFS transporter [Xanthobacteraceae bacterium]|nr:MFS transporter [Xanthobacteraceae bacterium]
MLPAGTSAAADPSVGRLIKLMSLLWLAGVAMRMTILAMPPVIPLVHDELHMSETQIGLLIGLPLAVFAIAAVPGSLLIARIGVNRAIILGMIITALAGGARGAAIDVSTLYAATLATGFGIAIMQPGLPTLVQLWLPNRIALGTIAYTGGMLIGTMFSTALTIPFVLPLVGGSWRLDLLAWAVPALLIAPVFFLLSPHGIDRVAAAKLIGGRWWPNFRNPLVWLLGLTFGSNNSPFFATNAFLGDYLAAQGKVDLLGTALAWLNGAQIVAPFILLLLADRLQRRAWPFLLFGPLLLAAFLGLIFSQSTAVIIVCAGLVGFTTAITLTATLTLPPLLSAPADLPSVAAGMFTVSYTTAIIIPTICGALWDLTGKPWTAFVPLTLCAVSLTVLGVTAVRYQPAIEKGIILQ